MPRPALPPTPASSSDIKGRDGSHMGALQTSFELPPPAIVESDSRSSSASTKSSSTSSYNPTSPKSPMLAHKTSGASSRQRSSVGQASTNDAFTLPPPPSRSRKIIQMKPRGQVHKEIDSAAVKGTGKIADQTIQTKKKQPSATSVAGRKIARKTAHSLIERRRRSKMNEEFSVLKNMIPACTGEMHKLAILQASIEYVRYLEDCIAQLKAQNTSNTSSTLEPPPIFQAQSPYTVPTAYSDDSGSDVEMLDSERPLPSYKSTTAHQPSISPELLAQDYRERQSSLASYTSPHLLPYNGASNNVSPAFGPGAYDYAISNTSQLTSPALAPQREERDLDQEATTALLMLNTDRRATNGNGVPSGRSMSVKDLLST